MISIQIGPLALPAAPLLVLDLRDGGWHAGAGVAAGLGWTAWQARREAAWRRALAAEGLTLDRVLLDRPSALGPALGSGGLPTTVFFGAQGRHAGAHMGILNRAALDARVLALQGR
jgi:hypothetical protein